MQNLCHFCLAGPVQPLLLTCGHLSCQRCSVLCLEEQKTGIKCYICGDETQMDDINELQRVNVVETVMEGSRFDATKAFDLSKEISIIDLQSEIKCQIHQKDYDLFCQNCFVPCCVICVHHSTIHKKHNIIPINKAMPKIIQSNKEFFIKQRAQVKKIADNISVCEQNKVYYENQARIIANTINNDNDEIIEVLKKRQQIIIEEVKQFMIENVQRINKTQRELVHQLSILKSFTKSESALSDSESALQLYLMQHQIYQQFDKVQPSMPLDEEQKPYIPFDFCNKPRIIEEINLYGRKKQKVNVSTHSKRSTTPKQQISSTTPTKFVASLNCKYHGKKIIAQQHSEDQENKENQKHSRKSSQTIKSFHRQSEIKVNPPSTPPYQDDSKKDSLNTSTIQQVLNLKNNNIQELKSSSKILESYNYDELGMIFSSLSKSLTLLLRQKGNSGGDLELKHPIQNSLGIVQLFNGDCFGWEMHSTNPKMNAPCFGDGYIFTLKNNLGTLPMKFQVKYECQSQAILFQRAGIGLGCQDSSKFDLYINFEDPRLCHSFLGKNFILVENLDGQTLLASSSSDWNIKMVEIFQLS